MPQNECVSDELSVVDEKTSTGILMMDALKIDFFLMTVLSAY
ncbi:hypothetical protein [Mucilaginibacter paludis]|nr:hypothetical protein [Mucilaginibacter paludis]